MERLDRPIRNRIAAFVDSLGENPIPTGVRKMAGHEGVYRKRFGNCRIIWEVRRKALTVLVVKVGHRRDVYR